jgi:hypothetical protein
MQNHKQDTLAKCFWQTNKQMIILKTIISNVRPFKFYIYKNFRDAFAFIYS